MHSLMSGISIIIIPLVIFIIPLYALLKKVPIYESFIDGAKEGIPVIINILPHLVGMIVAVTVFRESGAMSYYLQLLSPLANWFDIPKEVIPIGLLRPITSSGALALVESIIKTYGVDSFVAKMAATLQGSSETTFYVLTVYFGAIGIRKTLYSVKVGLLADLASFIAAVAVCSMFF